MLFAAVGLATALLWLAWVVWVPLLPTNLYVPLLDLGKITGYTWSSAIRFLAIVLGLYVLYAISYRLVGQGQAAAASVFGFAATFCLALIAAYPATAVDVFAYIAHGRILAQHHGNPFLAPASAYPEDPILPYLAFPDEPSQYGPLWVLLGGALSSVAGGHLLTEMLL
ncbi:MAG: hypothetical protein M3336_03050, partial [Chloroflexota bacterium]|nr:hypothetical protein [Chloroflexota bacterium]